MLKRLEQVEPIYKVADWIDDWRRKEELTEMITAFPEGVTIDHDMSLVSELKGVSIANYFTVHSYVHAVMYPHSHRVETRLMILRNRKCLSQKRKKQRQNLKIQIQ